MTKKTSTNDLPPYDTAQVESLYEGANHVSRNTIAVIDAMCKRGAVAGEELFSLGDLRNKCVEVVRLVEARQQVVMGGDSSNS